MAQRDSRLAVISGVAAAAGVGYLVCKYWNDAILCSPKTPQKLDNICKGSLPFLGDALEVGQNIDRLHDFWLENIEERLKEGKRGPFIMRVPFQPPMIFVFSEAAIQHIQKDKFPVYDKGHNTHSRMTDITGGGIFGVDGDSWKHQRKTASNIFNIKNFKDFVGVTFVEEIDKFTALLDDAAMSGKIVNLQDCFFRFTLDSFAKIAFGAELGCLDSKEPIPFAVAFDDAQTILFKRFFTPLWQYAQSLTGDSARQTRNVKVIRGFCYEFIENRLKQLEEGTIEVSNHDLLAFLMDSTVPATGKRPSKEELCDYVINFIIAGRDTTAQALSWAFLMLHNNPRTAEKLLDEINEAVADLGPDQHVSYEQIKSMKYANAVFHETLRLYPSVPTENKQANQDDYLPDGTFVPKGALVAWSIYAMGRLPSVWGPDAKEFRPERWLEMEKQPSPFKYNSFNAGPRVCLGKNFAELEGVFVLVETLRKFKVEVINPDKVTYAPSLTLPMKGGLNVKITRREQS